MDVRRVGGQQLGDFLSRSAVLSIPSIPSGRTGRTLRATEGINIRCVGSQQLGDFLGGSTILSGRAGRTSGTGRTGRTLLTLRNHHITAVGQENGITAHTQHLIGFILGDVAGIIVKGAYRNFGILDDGIQPYQIARMFGIEGVRHAHQLLHTFDGVVAAAFRIHFGFQEIGSHTPRNGGEITRNHGTVTHLQGHQTVGVGRHLMGFHINRCALWGTDQNGDLYRNGLIGH